METIISTMSVLPTTADEVIMFTHKLSDELTSGFINPLELLRIKRGIETVFENIKPLLDELAQEEAAKYHENNFEYRGIKIEKSSSVKYDYKVCGHPEYDRIIERKKELEAFFKTIKSPIHIANADTMGEEVMVLPPLKKSTDILKVSFIK